ncbi:MAG TPA: hypothetical protein VHW74_13145 [Mycobacteriales bacterium]|jgi:hypothetical protein|nr:hypothetical protein [Mycobacteriales bacterium]
MPTGVGCHPQVARRGSGNREDGRALDSMRGQGAALSTKRCLVTEQLTRTCAYDGLVDPEALAADLDRAFEHDEELAGPVTGWKMTSPG